jgi:uncharacterized membrane protein
MKHKLPILFSLIIILTITFFSSCYYDREDLLYPGSGTVNCTTVSAKYNTDVKPILQTKCNSAGCHNAASAAGGTVLETHAQVAAKTARITQRCFVDKTMPPGSPLSPGEISVIKCWIDSGAPNN